jgi:hypothetical protein
VYDTNEPTPDHLGLTLPPELLLPPELPLLLNDGEYDEYEEDDL